MVGLPTTSTDAADWRDPDPAAPVSGFDMGEGAPAAEAEQELSPEDAAWVDSCLVKNGGNGPAGGEGRGESQSDDAWATLTEAFIHALAYSASGIATATATQEEEGKKEEVAESSALVNGGGDGSGEASRVDGSGDELMTYEDAVTGEAASPTASAYAGTFYDQASPTLGDSLSGEGPSALADQFEGTAEGNTSSSSDGGLDAAAAVVIGNEYREEQEGLGDGEEEFSILASEEVGEVELTRDIFRVWELDVAEEDGDEDEDEEEFGRQLKRALERSSADGAAAGMPLPADSDSGAAALDAEDWRTSAVALDDENLEELIAGISDISLGRPPPSG